MPRAYYLNLIGARLMFAGVLAQGLTPARGQCLIQQLRPSDSTYNDAFGSAITLSGDTMLVGAPKLDGPTGLSQGAAYVFSKESNGWVQRQKLEASNGSEVDEFGWSVALDNQFAIIGAPYVRVTPCEGPVCYRGSVYVFQKVGGSWQEVQELFPVGLPADYAFGESLALAGDVLIVGANWAHESTGAAYVYRYMGDTWEYEQELVAPISTYRFGAAVAIGPSVAFVGTISAGHADTGVVFVFRYDGSSWAWDQTLKGAMLGDPNDGFGESVSLHADVLAVGAWFSEKLYIFREIGTTWSLESAFAAPSTDTAYGRAVATEANIVAVGASYGGAERTVYLYQYDGSEWSLADSIVRPDDLAEPTLFGDSVAIDGPNLAIGAPYYYFFSASPPGSLEVHDLAATPPDSPNAEPGSYPKSRYISFIPTSDPSPQALRTTMTSLHHPNPPYTGGPVSDFSSYESQDRWIGPPTQYLESSSNPVPFWSAELQCTPHYMDWSTVGVVHVTGREVIPSSVYDIRVIAEDCDVDQEGNYSAPLTISTSRWGDIEELFNPPSATVQPDVADISALVNKFRSAPGAPIKARALLAGDPPDPQNDLSFEHISACVDAFRGKPYPYGGPQLCP